MSGSEKALTDKKEYSIPKEYITPSETTNRLILLCIKVNKKVSDPRALGIVLDSYTREVIKARDVYKKQVKESGLYESIKESVDDVLMSFQEYIDVLMYVKAWFTNPESCPLDRAPRKISQAYIQLEESLARYEWDYLCSGDEPHPALNLMHKAIQATKQGAMEDERLNDIFDRLWNHFSPGLDTFAQDPDYNKRERGIDAINCILDGIQEMDAYFQQYDLNYLDSGYIRFRTGCLVFVELMQNSTGTALAEKPTPSPQANWVIHAARAVLEGLDPDILERAQNWFEPQLAESYFRFEQVAGKALNSGYPRIIEQVPIARDGFDRLNRSLPLLRLGISRHALLHKAIRYLEDGADLIHQAWQVFSKFEEDTNSVRCVRCGSANNSYSKVCSRCGAVLFIPVGLHSEYQESYAKPEPEPSENDTSDHLSRLIEACDAAKYGRLSYDEFESVLAWGKQLLKMTVVTVSELPESSGSEEVNRALKLLRVGLKEFREGTDEMQIWLETGAKFHLDTASEILLQAYTHFSEVQQIASQGE